MRRQWQVIVIGRGLAHVHETAVDVAELLETKQSRTVGRVIEDIAL